MIDDSAASVFYRRLAAALWICAEIQRRCASSSPEPPPIGPLLAELCTALEELEAMLPKDPASQTQPGALDIRHLDRPDSWSFVAWTGDKLDSASKPAQRLRDGWPELVRRMLRHDGPWREAVGYPAPPGREGNYLPEEHSAGARLDDDLDTIGHYLAKVHDELLDGGLVIRRR